jgi:hypothetical protein
VALDFIVRELPMVSEDGEDEDGARTVTANLETWSTTWLSSCGSSETRVEAVMASGTSAMLLRDDSGRNPRIRRCGEVRE